MGNLVIIYCILFLNIFPGSVGGVQGKKKLASSDEKGEKPVGGKVNAASSGPVLGKSHPKGKAFKTYNLYILCIAYL